MDYQEYQNQFFIDPPPEPRFHYQGLYGITLYYQDYEQAVAYYTQVLGPPAYMEGDSTRGWRVGETWLTLLRGQQGNPANLEIMLQMTSPQEADTLQQAFIAAGGQGAAPLDTLMYRPVHCCYVTDPLGTQLMIYSWLGEAGRAGPAG